MFCTVFFLAATVSTPSRFTFFPLMISVLWNLKSFLHRKDQKSAKIQPSLVIHILNPEGNFLSDSVVFPGKRHTPVGSDKSVRKFKDTTHRVGSHTWDSQPSAGLSSPPPSDMLLNFGSLSLLIFIVVQAMFPLSLCVYHLPVTFWFEPFYSSSL